MRASLRVVLALVTTVATFYFVYWVGGALLYSASLPWLVSFLAAIVAAAIAGRYVWRASESFDGALARSVLFGALITGAIAFSIGFFGPLIFMPKANQGPLLGLFITGPLGVIAGAVGGAIHWSVRRRRTAAADDRAD